LIFCLRVVVVVVIASLLDPKDWFRGEDQDKNGRRRSS
jgi:hypothetical protein